jgi:hypothetical protein
MMTEEDAPAVTILCSIHFLLFSLNFQGEKWRYLKRDEDVELYRTRGTLETKYDQTDQRFLPKGKSSKEEERLQREAARKEREVVSPPRARPPKKEVRKEKSREGERVFG